MYLSTVINRKLSRYIFLSNILITFETWLELCESRTNHRRRHRFQKTVASKNANTPKSAKKDLLTGIIRTIFLGRRICGCVLFDNLSVQFFLWCKWACITREKNVNFDSPKRNSGRRRRRSAVMCWATPSFCSAIIMLVFYDAICLITGPGKLTLRFPVITYLTFLINVPLWEDALLKKIFQTITRSIYVKKKISLTGLVKNQHLCSYQPLENPCKLRIEKTFVLLRWVL